MRIVQTFWTAGKDPLHESFGWLHPEYNLMSWALSCLSLRAHYDEVALYTDSVGKHLLIDKLKLPYTEVNVVFDDFECLPQHWALSKIKTYSLQTEPFLHVDGDVYISKPLPEDVIHSPLVAQNREIGTSYYKHMMNRIQSRPEIKLPEYVVKGLNEESVASYNMGFFGGTDVDFIQRYCDEVFHFMDSNNMNDPTSIGANLDCNVFFEQVIFAVYADREKRKVASVLGKDMHDKGYTRSEFCNLKHFDRYPFFHLLGGHKRNHENTEMLEKCILQRHPQYYIPIISNYPDKHVRFETPGQTAERITSNYQISQYNSFLSECINKWKDIEISILYSLARISAHNTYFSTLGQHAPEKLLFRLNPYMESFPIPSGWNLDVIKQLSSRTGYNGPNCLKQVAIIPTLQRCGYKEIFVGYVEMEIIELMRGKNLTINEIFDGIENRFKKGGCNESERDGLKLIVSQEVESLLYKNILITNNIQDYE